MNQSIFCSTGRTHEDAKGNIEAAQSDDWAGEAIPDNTTLAVLSCACYSLSIGHERHAMIIIWQGGEGIRKHAPPLQPRVWLRVW